MRKRRLGPAIKSASYLSKSAVWIVAGIIILLVLYFMAGYTFRYLRTSDYFKVKDIITREANTADLSYLQGRNIFGLDLREEARSILELCPDCSRVRLFRVLPNRIFVDFIKRKPQGLVKLYKYFAIDENGVLFSVSGDPGESELPVIVGLETRIFGPKPGRSYNIKELALALSIIKEAKVNKALKNYKIRKINVADAANAAFFIQIFPKTETPADFESLEVKIGQDNIREKIAVLGGLMIEEKPGLNNIKYIDLRFKDAVIKFRDAK